MFRAMFMIVKAYDEPLLLNGQEFNTRIKERNDGELIYINGESFVSLTTTNKSVNET